MIGLVRPLAVGVVLTVAGAGGVGGCDTTGGGTSGSTTPAVHGDYTTCPAGWRCGTCPNGDWWGYDPAVNDPLASTVIFDDKHPCG